jgi:twitching motility two-component system response regulator PilH
MLPTQPLNAPKILVVDDSWTYLAHIASLLTSHYFAVVTASDGEEALEKLPQTQPNCVLLDIILPRMNGYQVCRKIKQTDGWRNIPVILMSTKNSPTDRSWGLQQGADAYLVKPFSDDELLQMIRRMIWPNAR